MLQPEMYLIHNLFIYSEPPVNEFDGWEDPVPPTRRVTRRRGAKGSSSVGGVNVGTILTQVGSQKQK
jgi:hypothetical protein